MRGRPLSRIAILVAAAAVVAMALVATSPGGETYTLRARFADAAGLRDNGSVKIDGVPVGKVTSLDVDDGDVAVATLKIDRAAGHVGEGARAHVRSANLLGEKYVDLDLGDQSRPKPSGGTTIPVERTGAPVELDDLLNVLDDRTRTLLGVLINESGIALSGRGSDFNQMLAQLPPTLDRAGVLLATLSEDNRALGRLVEESDRFLGSVARERASLGRWVESVDGALNSLASRHAHLQRTIEESPATLSQLRTSLTRLDETAAALGPAAAMLRRGAPGMTAFLREVPPFSRAAAPALRTASRVSPSLERLGREATPVMRRMRPLAADLRTFAEAFAPAMETFDKTMDDLLAFAEGWARAIQVRDGASHMFRADLSSDDEFMRSIIDRYLRPPSGAERRNGSGGRSEEPPQKRRPSTANRQLEAAQPPGPTDGIPPHSPTQPAAPSPLDPLLDYLLSP